MFCTETLDTCTIIKIENLIPKKLSLADANSVLKDGFILVAKEGSSYKCYLNLGFEPTTIEKEGLKKFLMSLGRINNSEVRNTILEIDFPGFIAPFFEALNSIPGCCVNPNMFHSNGAVYISVEYHHSVTKQVNDLVTKFLIEDHIFPKEFIYSGTQKGQLPYLLQLYAKSGNDLGDFLLVKTVWLFEANEIETQNEGVLMNRGSYILKQFTDGERETLIFKTDTSDMKGQVEGKVISREENLVEFSVKSHFFQDFSNEVIKKYSGPIFLHTELSPQKQVSYYIFEKELQSAFLKGIISHWNRPARSEHKNYIEMVESLDRVANRLAFP